MQLEKTEDQQELAAVVRRFGQEKATSGEIRRLMETAEGFDPAVWGQMASQLGLQGLGIPEAYGGSGGGFAEVAVALEETGRALLAAPYLPTVLAAQAILAAGDETAAKELLPEIVAGATIGTLVLDATLTARDLGDGWRLHGTLPHVPEGHAANLIVAAAQTGDGAGLFAVTDDAEGLARTRLTGVDLVRRRSRIAFENTPARLLGTGDELLSRARDLAAACLAAEQIGLAQRCLDMAVDYAKIRYQFGRPIGSFQAIKHRLADMYTQLELARSTAAYAVWAADAAPDELPEAASLAKVACSTAAFDIATACVRVHGGIGYTWEHDAHLYFRRAKADQLLFGSPARHRELLAQRAGLGGSR